MKLTLGFSPCPNDTFIFDAMLHGKIDTRGLQFDVVMEDVETLNEWALTGKLHVTKLSYSTLLHTTRHYALLHSGSALGMGVGPLLVAKQPLNPADAANWRIAIPGLHTTANLLLSLALPQAANKTPTLFSDIEQAVLDGNYDAGLIIHEGRFTYAQKGLVKLMDLGDWWEHTVQAAIPLGGIVAKRELGHDVAATIDAVLKDSIAYAWKNYPTLSHYVTDNAQEMQEDVMRQHINLYVNEYTADLGNAGRSAIQTLFAKAQEAGMIDAQPNNIFY
ncbi:1,4-dihydroxy-6-naphthoate synthase [Chitinophagaceae bacterium IBVUCB1]|nr:1,4-dihydroxy-6-naphthoate synthase [Chitinophagaceae bacterium IBVUCB1]